MSASQLAETAYGATASPLRTDRSTEYRVFQSVTAALRKATQATADMAARAKALHDNRRLWTILATDLAAPENALPEGLRAQLFYLAEFSLLNSRRALSEPEALQGLIDVNTAVMRGLSGREATG